MPDAFAPTSAPISDQTPLADFEKVVKVHGSAVAIESMFDAVSKLVQRSSSTQYYDEAISCLHAAKEATKNVRTIPLAHGFKQADVDARQSPTGEVAFSKARAKLEAAISGNPKKRAFVALMVQESL